MLTHKGPTTPVGPFAVHQDDEHQKVADRERPAEPRAGHPTDRFSTCIATSADRGASRTHVFAHAATPAACLCTFVTEGEGIWISADALHTQTETARFLGKEAHVSWAGQ